MSAKDPRLEGTHLFLGDLRLPLLSISVGEYTLPSIPTVIPLTIASITPTTANLSQEFPRSSHRPDHVPPVLSQPLGLPTTFTCATRATTASVLRWSSPRALPLLEILRWDSPTIHLAGHVPVQRSCLLLARAFRAKTLLERVPTPSRSSH